MGKTGRPSKYDPKKHPDLAFWMAHAGLTNKQIAEEFGVTERTIDNWKRDHPEFFRSLKKGKETPDDQVEAALLRRAKGFTYTEESPQGVVKKVALPNPASMIFWLKNRRPKRWREKIEHQIGEGGPVKIEVVYDDSDKPEGTAEEHEVSSEAS